MQRLCRYIITIQYLCFVQKGKTDEATTSSSKHYDNQFDRIVVTEADSAQSEDMVTEGNNLLSQSPEVESVESSSHKIEDR